MNKWLNNSEVLSTMIVPAVFGISIAASRILSYCNLSLGLSVYLLEKGGDDMKKWIKNLAVLSLFLAVIVIGGVSISQAAGFGQRHDASVTLLSSLNPPLSIDQQDQLKSIVTTYGPPLKTLRQQHYVAKKQLNTLAQATPVDQTAIQAQAQAVAGIEAQVAVQHAQLSSALTAVLTPEQAQQLNAMYERRAGAKIDRLLLNYARYLEKQ